MPLYSTISGAEQQFQESFHTIPDCCIFGSITHTFGASVACQFFSHLLKSDSILWISPPFFSSGCWPIALLIYGDIPPYLTQHTTPSIGPGGRPVLVLDHVVDISRGPIIPQTLYRPFSDRAFRQHVTEAQLEPPIFFVQESGSLGFRLADGRLAGGLPILRGMNAIARLGGQSSKHFRIMVGILFDHHSTMNTYKLSERAMAWLPCLEEAVPDP